MTLNFHQKAMLILLVTVLLSVGVFLWIVVLNKGTLQITGDANYSVEASGDQLKISETATCETDPCEISLPTGIFTINLTKSGYFEESTTVEIKRGQVTKISADFAYIPSVGAVGPYDSFDFEFSKEDLSDDFSFTYDEEYDKQRLDFTDPDNGEVMIWSYFDRELVDPLVFAQPSLNAVLVVDRADEQNSLYLIDGQKFYRSYVGQSPNVIQVLWSEDPSEFLIQSESSSGSASLWLVSDGVNPTQWPLDLNLEKIVWDGDYNLVFATQQNLEAIEGVQDETTLDILMGLLNGDYATDSSTNFFIGQYDVSTATYRNLYEVPNSLELDFEAIVMTYDSETNRIYFTDQENVYEVTRD